MLEIWILEFEIWNLNGKCHNLSHLQYIFDLDGTLVNSLEYLADSMNSILEKFNFPTHSLQTYKQFIGNGIQNLVYKSLPTIQENLQLVRIWCIFASK